MPTTFTGGDLKVAAQQSIANVQETLLPIKAFSKKVDTSGLGKNDTTQVFVVGNAPEAKSFDRDDNNYMTDNGGEHAWKDVKLTEHKKLTFKIPPQIFKKLSTTDLADLYKPYVSKLCDGIIASAFKEIIAANFSKELDVGLEKDFDKDVASQAEKELAKLVGASGERNLVLNMDYHAALRESLVGLYVNPANSQALVQGIISGISGFASVIRTTALKPVGTDKKKYLVGIATNMSGLAMAFAPVEAIPEFTGDLEVISSDETFGIPITFSVDCSKDNRDYVATVEALYGVGVMDGKGILRLTAEVK